jgi:hypothetical protein
LQRFPSIELIGALSEPRKRASWARLAKRLAELRALPTDELRRRKRTRAAQGWVWPAIRRVLSDAKEPMQPVAIYAAVVEDLDTRVSKSTIKNELRRRLAMKPNELEQNDAAAYSLVSSSASETAETSRAASSASGWASSLAAPQSTAAATPESTGIRA